MKTISMVVALVAAVFVSVAQAAIVTVADGDYFIYSPDDTHEFDGFLASEENIWGFGFGFTDPDHYFDLIIEAPTGMPGVLEYAVSSGPDGTGLMVFNGALSAGELVTLPLGGAVWASPSSPADSYFAMYNSSIPSPVNFDGLSDGSADPAGTVPIPSAVWLFGSGLIGLVGIARRRR